MRDAKVNNEEFFYVMLRNLHFILEQKKIPEWLGEFAKWASGLCFR